MGKVKGDGSGYPAPLPSRPTSYVTLANIAVAPHSIMAIIKNPDVAGCAVMVQVGVSTATLHCNLDMSEVVAALDECGQEQDQYQLDMRNWYEVDGARRLAVTP